MGSYSLVEVNEKQQFIEIWLGHLKVSMFCFPFHPTDASQFNEVFREVVAFITPIDNFLCIQCG